MSELSSAPEPSNGRLVQVCEGCRVRHVKCDQVEEQCGQCKAIGLECVRQSTFRFKNVLGKVDSLANAFPSEQIWTTLTGALRYCDETPSLIEHYQGILNRVSQTGLEPPPAEPSPAYRPGGTPHQAYLSPPTDQTCPSTLRNILNPTFDAIQASPAGSQTSPSSLSGRAGLQYSATQASQSDTHTSPGSFAGYTVQQAAPTQPLTESEALLMRNFVDNMASWADGTDVSRSFELEVPRRALSDPLLRHAVCAFSSRHLNRFSDSGKTEALEHQDKCVELLIPAMSGRETITANVLAAVAILRQNEEMDEHDNRFHLEGVTRIMNTVSNFASSGGLGEAAAWLCLREDIYVALTSQLPIRTSLENFRDSITLRRNDDSAWANKMVLLLAELLNGIFGETSQRSVIARIEAEILEWERSKPSSFQPILYQPRSAAEGRYFPELWMLASHHAVGLQYYHISQIVLDVSRQRTSTKLYEHMREHRAIERKVRKHLLVVVGLAKSNQKAENALYTARHCLSVWGGSLHKKTDQHAALLFLRDMERRTGWRMTKTIDELMFHWEEDSEDD